MPVLLYVVSIYPLFFFFIVIPIVSGPSAAAIHAILARVPAPDQDQLRHALDAAKANGFDTDRLVMTPQGDRAIQAQQ